MTEYEKIESNFKQWTNKGEEVEGKLVEIREGNYGKVFDIETKDGKVTVGGTVVANKLTQEMVGKKVKIVYKGEVKSPTSRQLYKDFDVFVERSVL